MEPPRRRLGGWIEWHLMPFMEEHPVLSKLAVAGVLFGLVFLYRFFQDGPLEIRKDVGPFLACFGWMGIVAFAWWAGDWDIRHRRARVERMRRNHLCVHCGYDLRETPDRCPECGKRPSDPVEGI